MDYDRVRREVESVIRWSEIRAVAVAIRSGHRPVVGQMIDYVIESPKERRTRIAPSFKRERPYRVAVQQWHLDEAERWLEAQPLAPGSSPSRGASCSSSIEKLSSRLGSFADL